jgi:hypothetical protein
MSSSTIKTSIPAETLPDWLEIVRHKVESLSFGVVQIVVHDRKVAQIERTEKTRLDSPPAEAPRRRENY